jgi:hypothetical protein
MGQGVCVVHGGCLHSRCSIRVAELWQVPERDEGTIFRVHIVGHAYVQEKLAVFPLHHVIPAQLGIILAELCERILAGDDLHHGALLHRSAIHDKEKGREPMEVF